MNGESLEKRAHAHVIALGSTVRTGDVDMLLSKLSLSALSQIERPIRGENFQIFVVKFKNRNACSCRLHRAVWRERRGL